MGLALAQMRPAREFRKPGTGGGPTGFAAGPPSLDQPACKPGSVWPAVTRRRDGHSSGTPVARRIKQPTRTADPDRWSDHVSARAERVLPFLFGLAPGGVCRAASVAGSAVRSCRTVSPLPRHHVMVPGGLFSVALSLGFASKAPPAGRYPAPSIRGARTFLPGRLSALARSGRPADW